MKNESHSIGCFDYCSALKYDRCLGSSAAEAPVKFQSDWTIRKQNWSLHEILQCNVLLDIETALLELH